MAANLIKTNMSPILILFIYDTQNSFYKKLYCCISLQIFSYDLNSFMSSL
jgi:hypothetical protein